MLHPNFINCPRSHPVFRKLKILFVLFSSLGFLSFLLLWVYNFQILFLLHQSVVVFSVSNPYYRLNFDFTPRFHFPPRPLCRSLVPEWH